METRKNESCLKGGNESRGRFAKGDWGRPKFQNSTIYYFFYYFKVLFRYFSGILSF